MADLCRIALSVRPGSGIVSRMKKNMLSFRCPHELLDCIDGLSEQNNSTRSALIVDAIRSLNREVQRRENRWVPPYREKLMLQFHGVLETDS